MLKLLIRLPDNGGSPEKFNISFKVDDGANPIGGAVVSIDGVDKTTGSAGGCSFTGVTGGNVSVTVSKDGYESKTEVIMVDEDNTSFTISLTAN